MRPASPGVLVHGGAGDVARERLPSHLAGVSRASRAGCEVLRAGGSAVDAVVRAVQVLEDDPCFNAGRGACLNSEGAVELDAAVMDGATLDAGAVCALPPFRSPVAVAQAVLRARKHVLYAGEGAARFARREGFEQVSPDLLITHAARAKWLLVREGRVPAGWAGGTVGAVAWDGAHLAAATSTGGTVLKEPGRVGDSSVLGAGTLADDFLGAVSVTGAGEAILRVSLARLVAEWLGAGVPATEAVERGLARLRERGRGEGGLIAMAPDGTPTWGRNTRTMSHAYTALDGTFFEGA